MKRASLFVVCFAAAVVAQKRPITHEDVWLMKRVGEPAVSPDGRSIVFTVTEPSYDPAKQSADLWMIPADGGTPARRITFNRAPEYGTVWSPDGTRIAFIARRDGDEAPQAYVLNMSGGEAQRVTVVPGGVASVQWRPDGKAILFESEYDPLSAERKQRKWNARTYDSMPVRYWNTWLDEKRLHIFTQELREGAAPVDLLKGSNLAASPGFAGTFLPSGGTTLQPLWFPDGKSIVFVAMVNRNQMMSERSYSALFTVSASGGEPRQLTQKGAEYSKPKFSPRGDALYALQERHNPPGERLYSLSRLVKWSWPVKGEPAVLTEAWDRSVSGYTLSADGQMVYIEAEDAGHDGLFQIAAAGGTVEPALKVTRGGYSTPHPTRAGLTALFQTSVQPPELVRLDAKTGAHKPLTRFNDETVARIEARDPIQFWFTAKDGRRIHNLLFLPPQFDDTKKYPLVIFPHGGPAVMSKDGFSGRWNNALLASPGYVVLATNYTGSTGFGEEFADDIEKDVLRGPANEILEAIDEAGRRYPFVDLARQAAVGASYGGYIVNWLNGHTKQFKCMVAHAGAINNESQYGVNDGGLERELRMGGPVWEKGGQWMDQSPIRYSGSFGTPTLITQGENDFRVPLNESMTTFKLLQRRNIPARLVIFPEEGHWILKGENSRHHMEEVLGWLKRYL